MLGIVVYFHDCEHMMYTSPATSAEYGDLIYINLLTEFGVAVLQAVKTEANMPISIQACQ
jgi:hypothetical protein